MSKNKNNRLAWHPFYFGDYELDTKNLTTLEHGTYFLLMKHIYLTYEGIPHKNRYEIAKTTSKSTKKTTDKILTTYFQSSDENGQKIWHHKRIKETILGSISSHEKATEKSRHAALVRWRKEKGDASSNAPSIAPGNAPSIDNLDAPSIASSSAPSNASRNANSQFTGSYEERSSQEPLDRKEKFEARHFQVAKRIANHLVGVKGLNVTNAQISNWSRQIALLERIDLKNRELPFDDIKIAALALENHSESDFFPVIESGNSFREKFMKIEEFLKRERSKNKSSGRGIDKSINAAKSFLAREVDDA